MKILAIKFKFLGDIAMMSASLRALKEAYPDAEIHCLVPEAGKVILSHIPWVKKIWSVPKKLSKGGWKEVLKTIRLLREEGFDLSVDFVGNDRGAIFSYLIGSDTRLGPISSRGFLGREYLYNVRIEEARGGMNQIDRDLVLLSRIGVPYPSSLAPELYADPTLAAYAKNIVSGETVYCHLGTSTDSKEWPVNQWVALWKNYPDLRERLVFGAGPSLREQELLKGLHSEIPEAKILMQSPSIAELMAIIKESRAVISGDTFAAHLAAGLKTPVVDIFGPTTAHCWAPKDYCVAVEAEGCHCRHFFYKCTHPVHCLSLISAETIYNALNEALHKYPK